MLITLNQIPVTIQEFQTCPQLDLSKPENTCAMFLCALQLYIKDKDAGAVSYTHLSKAGNGRMVVVRIPCLPPSGIR